MKSLASSFVNCVCGCRLLMCRHAVLFVYHMVLVLLQHNSILRRVGSCV